MAATSPLPTCDPVVELACFLAGGQLYGVDVVQIREIVRSQEPTPLPRAPELVEGVIDLRGTVIPVVDLGRALGQPDDAPRAHIAVLDVDDMLVGLRVESAVDVLSVDPAWLGEPPALTSQAGYDLVRAVVRRPGAEPVLALSIEHLIERIYRTALETGGSA